MREEPLFYNPVVPAVALQPHSLRAGFIQAGITKLQHLVKAFSWCSLDEVVSRTGINSVHMIQKTFTEIQNVVEVKHLLWSPMNFTEDLELFPEVQVRSAEE